MQEPELGAGIDAEFAGQDAPHVLVGGEGVGLPAAAVQAQHQLRVELLLQRVSRDQLAQFRHDLAVPAQVQIGVDPRGQRLQPLVFDGGTSRSRSSCEGTSASGSPRHNPSASRSRPAACAQFPAAAAAWPRAASTLNSRTSNSPSSTLIR